MNLAHDITDKILDYEQLPKVRDKHDSIAFVSGCYDILQSGHPYFFEQAKEYADTLVVGVGSDRIIKELKGPSRPINPENNRAFLIAALGSVDYAVINDENLEPGKINFKECLDQLKPDYFVLNDDDGAIKEKQALCDRLGIELKLVSRVVPKYLKPTSTTEIINYCTR